MGHKAIGPKPKGNFRDGSQLPNFQINVPVL
jgi:hypothetical protein